MHWLSKIEVLIRSQSADLRALAEFLDCSPATFYMYQDLSGCDLRGQNLKGMNFTGCNIEKALFDISTQIDPEFDPRPQYSSDYVDVEITRDLNKIILDFAEEYSYTYPAWAFKALLDRGINAHRKSRLSYYGGVIKSNIYFENLLDHTSRSSCTTRKLQIYRKQQRYISEEMLLMNVRNRFGFVMLVGLLAIKIPFGSRKDYSTLAPNTLVSRRRTGVVVTAT